MLSISVGPFALPVAPVLLLVAVWVASALAGRVARAAGAGPSADPLAERGAEPSAPVSASAGPGQRGEAASQAVFTAAILGLLGARLAHLALHAESYFAEPWAAIDIRDGGWNLATGALAGSAWLLWRAWRAAELRRALASGVAAGVALWLAGAGFTGRFSAPEMPAVVLQALEGHASPGPLTLAQAARGRPAVVNLWASWCGPCRQEMPMLAAAQQRETAVAFLFVNQGEPAAAVHAYMTSQGLALREVLRDPRSALGPAVGSRGLPTTLFYDAQGKLVDAHFGVLNAAALAGRLKTLRPAGVTPNLNPENRKTP